MTLTVGALWRYPVKTLAGECLDTAEITTNGIIGDRSPRARPGGLLPGRGPGRRHRPVDSRAKCRKPGNAVVPGLP